MLLTPPEWPTVRWQQGCAALCMLGVLTLLILGFGAVMIVAFTDMFKIMAMSAAISGWGSVIIGAVMSTLCAVIVVFGVRAIGRNTRGMR